MAPTKTKAVKPTSSKRDKNLGKSNSSIAKSKVSKRPAPSKPVQQKTKSKVKPQQKKKRKVYTDKELGLPTLNMITPVGVDLPKGKKKGKVFVDDQVNRILIGITLQERAQLMR